MKSVIALALVGAVAAVPAGWSDAPVDPIKSTTTTTAASSTWADVSYTTTTTKPVDPKTWEDVVSSTTADPKTWEDVVSSTTTDPKTWEDYTTPAVETSTSTYWGDYSSAPVTETITTLTAITTYVPHATKFTDKGDVYTVTEATTLTLTKGPYTVTIPIYEETSTVCDDAATSTGTWADASVPAGPTDAASTWVDAAVPTGASPVKPVSPAEPVSPYTGSASKMAGAGLAGVAAIAALLL